MEMSAGKKIGRTYAIWRTSNDNVFVSKCPKQKPHSLL